MQMEGAMGRRAMQITWAELKARIRKAQEEKGTVSIACGAGLYLRIFGVNRNANWYYRAGGRASFELIADYPRTSLLDARRIISEKAEALKIAQDEEAARNAATFGQEAKNGLKPRRSTSALPTSARASNIFRRSSPSRFPKSRTRWSRRPCLPRRSLPTRLKNALERCATSWISQSRTSSSKAIPARS